MGAHQQLQLAIGQVLQQLPPPGRRGGTAEKVNGYMQLGQPLAELLVMLLGQHLRGGHQRPLVAAING